MVIMPFRGRVEHVVFADFAAQDQFFDLFVHGHDLINSDPAFITDALAGFAALAGI